MNLVKSIQADEVNRAIQAMAREIAERHGKTEQLALVSIADGGPPLGAVLLKAVQDIIQKPILSGTIDIAFHRDDIEQRPISKYTEPTNIEFHIKDATIILADDVLFTGRSTRAAINEIFDLGRPECVELAVLFDRKGRRLPIEANYIGFEEFIPLEHRVVVTIEPNDAQKNRVEILTS